jgi:hypothetical protein
VRIPVKRWGNGTEKSVIVERFQLRNCPFRVTRPSASTDCVPRPHPLSPFPCSPTVPDTGHHRHIIFSHGHCTFSTRHLTFFIAILTPNPLHDFYISITTTHAQVPLFQSFQAYQACQAVPDTSMPQLDNLPKSIPQRANPHQLPIRGDSRPLATHKTTEGCPLQ